MKDSGVRGLLVDSQSRCIHYHSLKDIISIKFYCCGEYFPCYQCHQAEAGHSAKVWPKEQFNELAVLCGVCKCEISIEEYLFSESECPNCQSAFNPGCSLHYHLYFDI
ncbi:hypothetical protein GJU40_01240 [Bacillus lacus]|uniref:CHY-type domain-containing protein n=1 Tax=Metabacillus lacus TaxID=1983721 RepID=A0A7X2LYM4_9BACI|nr:CHY zinc finger protein [Metabacillus lacus]MRX70789.1 hypothetical protein [Metabacillus lacus]